MEIEEKPTSKGEDKKVATYLKEIKLAEKNERGWKDDADRAWKVYRGKAGSGGSKDGNTFNILWSNVEIKRQAVYSAVPKPDIRRRIKDKDPLSKAVSELLERAVTYVLDCADMDGALISAANDYLIPGRANIRAKYVAPMVMGDDGEETDEIEHQEIKIEHIRWDEFVRGPGDSWKEVPWIAFKHKITKHEAKERWGEVADALSYDLMPEQDDEDKKESEDTDGKLALIYELWDKDEKKVYWIAKSYADDFLETVDDPLELDDFWPIPEPLRAIEDSASLVPQTEYSKYETLAEELEIVTKRRNKIASALRVRGIYDSTLAEMSKLLESGDNEMIACESASKLMKEGGLDKAVWMLPVETLVNVYQILGQQRSELVGQIYEITGISDIIRGNTDPTETLGAQEIKANFGSMRLEKQKQAIQKYARNLIRIIAEIIAENYTPETLTAMTGLKFPTAIEQQLAQQEMMILQQQAQMAQQTGQQNPQIQQAMQKAQAVLSQPNWDSIMQILKSDLMREYKIDIETDSTIAVDHQKDQQQMAEFANAMTGMNRALGEMATTGALSPPAIGKIMLSMVRKFRMGKDVEDEMENSIENPPPPKPDPKAEAEKIKMQNEQQKHQMDMQAMQAKLEGDKQKQQMDLQAAQQKHELEVRKIQAEIEKMRAELQIEQQRMAIERERLGMEAQKMQIDAAMTERKARIDAESMEHKAEIQARQSEIQSEAMENKGEYEKSAHKRKMESMSVTQ